MKQRRNQVLKNSAVMVHAHSLTEHGASHSSLHKHSHNIGLNLQMRHGLDFAAFPIKQAPSKAELKQIALRRYLGVSLCYPG
ncbi:hypothetical protein [Agarivorans gilvus]|uniref:hypothetical protein n=1 Tax=Agarivorans gilvus TaxID=680279 RepID=UPI0012ED2D31|nr:hypothetical protein [Agarivorans gilvus]